MNTTDDVRPPLTGHLTPVDARAVAAIAVPTVLVRRVLAHHRAHGSTLFLHRLLSR
jgi:hypothetical protein